MAACAALLLPVMARVLVALPRKAACCLPGIACTANRRLTLGTPGCRYIEYEKQVEALRVARKRSRKLDGKPSLADHAGVRRVHFVFERATRKFPGDLRLWTLWLHYCRESKSTRRISRVSTPLNPVHVWPRFSARWTTCAYPLRGRTCLVVNYSVRLRLHPESSAP